MEFRVYPCNANLSIKKGFAMTICDGNGLINTILKWRRYSANFRIKYYALSVDDGPFTRFKL